MRKLNETGNQITRIKTRHNCTKAAKRDSSEGNNLKDLLYLSVGVDVMLTSNFWTDVGLHNGTKK